MTRHPSDGARIQRVWSEHFFGVGVVTFDSCHCTQFTDLVCANMSVTSGKVLSPEDEGLMAGIAFVIISPRLVLDMCICAIFAVFCNIQGFLILSYVHAPRPCIRVHRETGVLRVLLSGDAGPSHTIGAHQLD